VGEHSAPDGAPPHPLVSGGRAARPGGAVGAHREQAGSDSPVGWPGTPDGGDRLPGEGPIGWPGDLREAAGGAPADAA
jgi:hypothetical protein